MTSWLKRSLIGATAALALGGSIAAYSQAQSHWHGGPPSAEDMASHQAHMLEHIGQALDLDAAQKVKLKALADTLHAQHDAMMGPGQHERFAALVAGNTFDRAGAQALVDEKAKAVSARAPVVINAAGDFFDSLRPDQQQKARDFMARHHHGMMEHMPAPPATGS